MTPHREIGFTGDIFYAIEAATQEGAASSFY
jgi:hypothetical protein